MKRKVWVLGHNSSSIDDSGFTTEYFIDGHYETLDGTEAYINGFMSQSQYGGQTIKKRVSEPGTFGGRYEHNTFNPGNVTGVEAENRANDKNTGNWTDDSDS